MKFERVKGNVPVFSEDYDGRDRTIFGKEDQSDNINDQFTEEYKTGWGIVGKNEFPTLQDFNAFGYTLNKLISYLYQNGVAEYSDSADYYKGSLVEHAGDLYIAIVDNPEEEPTRGSLEWMTFRNIADNRFDGMLQIHADNTSGTGLFLLDNKGAVRGQMGFSNMGLQFAQHVDGNGYTYTLPHKSGEIALKETIDRASPVGFVANYIGETAPNSDWLIMRGQKYDRAKYSELYDLLKTDTLPDGRGVMLRGLDANRGFDPNRKLLSYQEDAMQKIAGSFDIRKRADGETSTSSVITSAAGSLEIEKFSVGTGSTYVGSLSDTGGTTRVGLDSSMSTRTNTQNETVSKNLSINIIIKVK